MKHFLWLLFFVGCSLEAAEPDWPVFEKRALEFLQEYVRVKSINPPADTSAAAALFRAELEKNGFAPKLFRTGPNGQTNLLVRLEEGTGRRSRCCS